MNRKFVTFVGMACLSAGMLWADVSSGHATGKRQHGLKSKHKHTSKSSIHALNPQPLPPGRKQALVSNETMKTQGNGGGTIKPDLNPQPLPPGAHSGGTGGNSFQSSAKPLNPQPLPPAKAQ